MSVPPIFISHSHFDNVLCRRIVAFLRERLGAGADIFFDESELHGGDDWFRRIQHEVIARPIFLVVLSRHSVVAAWVAEETNLALTKAVKDKTRKIIPVQIDAALTLAEIEQFAPILTLRQITHLHEGAPQANWDDLAAILQGQQVPLPPPADPVDRARQQELEQARDLVAQVHDAITQGQYRIATKLGREAVNQPGNERDATLWGELGMALVQIGETTEGMADLDTALKLNRNRPDLLRARAGVLVRQSKYAEALQAWDKAFVATGALSDRMAILNEAYSVLVGAQQWPLVKEVIADALDLAPTDASWLVRRQLLPVQERFQTASAAKHWADALTACEAALQIVPNDPTWQQHRTQAQAALAEEQRQAEVERQRQAAEAERQRQAAEAKLLPPTLRGKGFTMVAGKAIVPPTCTVPAGPFTMGGDPEAYNYASRGTPKVALTLGAFQIGTYPVTVAEYACAVLAEAVPAPTTAGNVSWAVQQQRLDHPVVCVSWGQAMDYAAWLAQVTGQPWRLPSEAEWEKAARGTDGRVYPWGNQWDNARANTNTGGPGTTTAVGAYAEKGDASPYGVHDMAGNVWEWTTSIWQEQYGAVKGENDSDRTSVRVLRGGAWYSDPRIVRAACRNWSGPDYFHINRGFRLASFVGAGT